MPPSEAAYDEVVETADQAAHGQQFCLRAALFARYEDLGCSRSLGEGVLAVHVLDEVFAEGYQHYDSEDTAHERGDEDLVELGLEAEDV